MRLRTTLPEPNAHVAVDIDVPGFRELLLERLASFD
jgi:inosine-uridine nucleoside N-ribohydrolase